MTKLVVGYHGTLLSSANALAMRKFDPGRESRRPRWLGNGLYFFEDNAQLAAFYAFQRQTKHQAPGAVLKARIRLGSCLDLSQDFGQRIARQAYTVLRKECVMDGAASPRQKPLEIHKGQVRAGYSGEWKDYGVNALDHAVVERAVMVAEELHGLRFDTVRGLFLDGGELYDTSWFFDLAHIAIAVRSPYAALEELEVIPL
jgi:hypothetical protein